MDGREFLSSAQRLVAGRAESDWRTAAGRAYYALLLETRTALQRWGFVPPRRDQIHAWIRLRLVYSKEHDLLQIGYALDDLGRLRNEADYQVERVGRFADASKARAAIGQSQKAIALLDQIENDPTRRAAAIAAIQATIVS